MIDSKNSEPPVPSILREPHGRHDSVMERIKIVKKSAEDRNFLAPEKFKDDEHYWFTVMDFYNVTMNRLSPYIKDKDQLKEASLLTATKDAEKFLEIEEDGMTDQLTKTWNRKALDGFLENMRARPLKEYKNGIFFADVDHFKEYNDKKGHTAADQILKNLVKLLKKSVRKSDMVARYGGEEIVIILTNIKAEVAPAIIKDKAEAIRSATEKYLGITISIGATTINDSDQNIEDIYRRVDGYMYKAKESGRNASCIDGELVIKNK